MHGTRCCRQMVADGEENGCKGEVAALTGQDSDAVTSSSFCSEDSLHLSIFASSMQAHII